jgi:hypothetical protein
VDERIVDLRESRLFVRIPKPDTQKSVANANASHTECIEAGETK